MDNFEAFNRPNSYPAYSLAALEKSVAAGNGTPAMLAEIEYRKARGFTMAAV